MRTFKRFWKLWLGIARPIGNFQARVLFSLFYYLLLFPVGVILRLFDDPLRISKSSYQHKKTAFVDWEHQKEDIRQARRPF